jgi:hypothetical protein
MKWMQRPSHMWLWPFRRAVPALNRLYREYRDRVAFYVVYIQEAHPIDAWQLDDNIDDDVLWRRRRPPTSDTRSPASA